MMQKWSSLKSGARRNQGPRVPGRGKEFLWRLQVNAPYCKSSSSSSSSYKQTFGKQLKSKALKNLAPRLARTWRAGMHGADLLVYWAHGSLGPSWQQVWHWCTQGARALLFFAKGEKHAFCNMYRAGASFSLPVYIYIYVYIKFQIRHWDENSNVKVFRP